MLLTSCQHARLSEKMNPETLSGTWYLGRMHKKFKGKEFFPVTRQNKVTEPIDHNQTRRVKDVRQRLRKAVNACYEREPFLQQYLNRFSGKCEACPRCGLAQTVPGPCCGKLKCVNCGFVAPSRYFED